MLSVVPYLLSPGTLFYAAIGAVAATRLISGELAFTFELVGAFIFSWLARPVLILIFASSLEGHALDNAFAFINYMGGGVTGIAFAFIGWLSCHMVKEAF